MKTSAAKQLQAAKPLVGFVENKIQFVWNHKIIVYSYMMTTVCITLEYRTIFHYDAHFNPKANFVNTL